MTVNSSLSASVTFTQHMSSAVLVVNCRAFAEDALLGPAEEFSIFAKGSKLPRHS